ncbi:MAG TPA: SLC13 family permease [Burkholderiales bacterium]|nr:SLC13 family permease [Burkholderiales bacterium]
MNSAAGLLPIAHEYASRGPLILAIFAITYFGIAVGRVPALKVNRVGIALLGAIALTIFAGVTTADVVSFINWPTVFLLFGFFVLSAQLRLSGFFDKVAIAVAARLGHPARFLLQLMLVTAGLSAVLNHDVVCLVFAPIIAAALIRQKINPVPFLIALAIASNIGAASTLVGNPQDMVIAQLARLDFGRYILWSIAPVLFALASAYAIIWMLSRKTLHSTVFPRTGAQRANRPFDRGHTIKGLVILAVVIALFFTSLPKEMIALAAAGIHIASRKFRTEELLGLVDWSILVLFIGLFVIAGAFQTTGYGELAVRWLANNGVNLGSLPVLTGVTAVLSNLLNNSAAVMLLLNVVDLSNPATAYTLALANSFGGSLVIIGSVSNIIVVQQARESGINISFYDFARVGVPVTLAALAGLIIWTMLPF